MIDLISIIDIMRRDLGEYYAFADDILSAIRKTIAKSQKISEAQIDAVRNIFYNSNSINDILRDNKLEYYRQVDNIFNYK